MDARSEKPPFAEEEGVFLLHKTLISMIEGSVGSAVFQKMFFEQYGEEVDVLRNGDLSCAVHVSFILYNLGLIKEPHTFVTHTVRDLEDSGWIQIDEPLPGAVLVWGDKLGDSGEIPPHIGFSLGEERAVSNVDVKQSPQEHHWTFGTNEDGSPKREVTAIYWHPSFDEELGRKQAVVT